jgi:hypothetical protein
VALTIARHESPELSWEMVSRDAGPLLRGLVRDYTGYLERSAESLCRREVPTGDVTLILSPHLSWICRIGPAPSWRLCTTRTRSFGTTAFRRGSRFG